MAAEAEASLGANTSLHPFASHLFQPAQPWHLPVVDLIKHAAQFRLTEGDTYSSEALPHLIAATFYPARLGTALGGLRGGR